MSPSPGFSLKQIAVPAFAPSILFGLAEGAVLPVIALTALEQGASPAVAGFIVALAGIGSLINNVPAAILTSRFGERRAILGAGFAAAVAYLVCMLAGNPWMLGLGVLLTGMAGSVFTLARQTWLIAAVPFGMRARALSTLAGSMRIGMFIGPFAGALVIHQTGLAGAYATGVLAMAVLLIVAWRMPDLPDPGASATAASGLEPEAGPGRFGIFGQLLRDHARIFLTVGMGVVLVAALRACRSAVIPLWGDALGLAPATTSVVFGLAALIDVVMFYPAGKVMDQLGRRWVAIPSMLLMGSALILMPWSTGYFGYLATAMLLGLGNGIGSGIVMTLGADASPLRHRTRFLGIWRMMADIGQSVGPVLLSTVTAVASLASGVRTIGVLGLVAALIFARTLPPSVPPDGPPPEVKPKDDRPAPRR